MIDGQERQEGLMAKLSSLEQAQAALQVNSAEWWAGEAPGPAPEKNAW